jgi:hypothetical protein
MIRRDFLKAALASVFAAPLLGVAKAAGYEVPTTDFQIQWVRFCAMNDSKTGIFEIKFRTLPDGEWKTIRKMVPKSRPMVKLSRDVEFGLTPILATTAVNVTDDFSMEWIR